MKESTYRVQGVSKEIQVNEQDIFSELYSGEQFISGDSSDRQTPQPDSTQHSIVEKFTRMVSEAANQPCSTESATKSNYVMKKMDSSLSASTSSVLPHSYEPSVNNLVKSEILNVNEIKNTLGPIVAVESYETPVVSAISECPVILSKISSIKQLKNIDQNFQSLVIENSISSDKNLKQKMSKPVVPLMKEVEKLPESHVSTHGAAVVSAVPASAPQPVVVAPAFTHSIIPVAPTPAPTSSLPQRVPKERLRFDEKFKHKEKDPNQDMDTYESNGLSSTPVNCSVDNTQENINQPTSQSSQPSSSEPRNKPGSSMQVLLFKTEACSSIEPKGSNKSEPALGPTPTQLLAASIEKAAAKEVTVIVSESTEKSATIQAQAKLTQSIASCIHSNQPDYNMKGLNNLNHRIADSDLANSNISRIAIVETIEEDFNKNNSNNTKSFDKKIRSKMTNETPEKELDAENGKEETDNIYEEQEVDLCKNKETTVKSSDQKPVAGLTSAVAPKYNYSPDQWSPFNKSGKKCYNIGFLKQIKDDPLSKNKPNVPLLEACNVMRTAPMLEPLYFATISRPVNDSLFPTFAKSSGVGTRNNAPRDIKKDGRNMTAGGKGSAKLPATPCSSGGHKPVIHVSLSLREEVKLNETKDPWKPLRFKKQNISEEEYKTQELNKKFTGILNKLTPQKFDTLLDKVKTLEINNQRRLEGVIDLVFEKAIDEPNFSEAYAAMCNRLSMLKVPADNATSPDQCVNFRALIISKCQNQFVTDKVDEQVLKLEKELNECIDSAKKKELQLMLEEEYRRVRMRSVGNVRFIGELYKLKMLTSKIMVYCMNYLIDKLEEEKLECLCKLLTTIGEQVESEVREPLDHVFKKMQEIVEKKSNKISSRVRWATMSS